MSFSEAVQPVQLAILARLSDNTIGFNPNFAAAVSTGIYNLPAEATATTVDWTLEGPNVGFGYLETSLNALTETSNFAFPFFTIEVVNGQAYQPGQGKSLFSYRFSGPLKCGIQAILSWEAAQITDFSGYANAVVDSILATMNAPGITPFGLGDGSVYAGQMTFAKSPVRKGGLDWFQSITFSFDLMLNVP